MHSILIGAQLMASQKSSTSTSQIINIPTTSISKTKSQFKTPKPVAQRLILPKSSAYKNIKPKAETVISPNNSSNYYPKLITPDLHQRTVSDYSVDTEFINREGSLLKPPILTTRPTVLKPFMLQSSEGMT